MWQAVRPIGRLGRWLGLLGLAALVPSFAACGHVDTASGPGPHVVAAFYPYAFIAERVMGGHGDVTNLTAPGVEPHDLELTPQQVAEISEADLVVYEQGFQPSVDTAMAQNPPAAALDAAGVVPPRDTADAAPGESSTAATVAQGEGDLAADPHLWQDPSLMVPITQRFAADIAQADPKHAADYRANAAALVSDLRSLDADFRTGLQSCARTEFVTSHAAFGYLAERYGLTMIPIAGLSPDVEPSPEHLAELQDIIEQDDITTVFSETLGSKQYADTLAADLGVQTAVLDPIEGLPDESSSQDYLSLMRTNLAALRKANGCT